MPPETVTPGSEENTPVENTTPTEQPGQAPPTEPASPEQPTEPEAPAEPTELETSPEPTTPEEPSQPSAPEEPETSTEPETPEEPAESEETPEEETPEEETPEEPEEIIHPPFDMIGKVKLSQTEFDVIDAEQAKKAVKKSDVTQHDKEELLQQIADDKLTYPYAEMLRMIMSADRQGQQYSGHL